MKLKRSHGILVFLLGIITNNYCTYLNYYYHTLIGKNSYVFDKMHPNETKKQRETLFNQYKKNYLAPFHPDKAQNFIENALYTKYSQLLAKAFDLIQTYNTTSANQLTLMLPMPPNEILEKIEFDFFQMIKNLVQQNQITSKEFVNFRKAISDYYSRSPVSQQAALEPLILISQYIAQQKQLISSWDAMAFYKTLSSKSIETIKTELTENLIKYFAYTFANQDYRNALLQRFLNEVQSLLNQNNFSKAEAMFNEFNKVKQTYWGSIFPVSQNLENQWAMIKQTIEDRKKTEMPAKVKDEIKRLKETIGRTFDPVQKNTYYQTLIATLKQYLPTTLNDIMQAYTDWIAMAQQFNLSNAPTILNDALEVIKSWLPKVLGAQRQMLQKKKEEFEKQRTAQPTPTPPSIPTEKLNQANAKIQAAEQTPNAQNAEKLYREAITIVEPYTPQTSAKIITIYIAIIDAYMKEKNISKAKNILAQAENKKNTLEQRAKNLSKFKEAVQNLQTRKQQIEAELKKQQPPKPTQPQPVPVNLDEIYKDLQSLNTSLTNMLNAFK